MVIQRKINLVINQDPIIILTNQNQMKAHKYIKWRLALLVI